MCAHAHLEFLFYLIHRCVLDRELWPRNGGVSEYLTNNCYLFQLRRGLPDGFRHEGARDLSDWHKKYAAPIRTDDVAVQRTHTTLLNRRSCRSRTSGTGRRGGGIARKQNAAEPPRHVRHGEFLFHRRFLRVSGETPMDFCVPVACVTPARYITGTLARQTRPRGEIRGEGLIVSRELYGKLENTRTFTVDDSACLLCCCSKRAGENENGIA